MVVIKAEQLTKEFKVIKKESGLSGALKNLFHSEKTTVKAVNAVSFEVEQGK